MNETAAEFHTKGVSGVMKEAFDDTADAMKDLGSKASNSFDRGMDWMAGEDFTEVDAPTRTRQGPRTGPPPSLPVWKPPVVEPPPRLENLRKGTKVYRRGGLAEVVKVDLVADPPACLVRMLEGGNEVGTDASNVSLDADGSAKCHAVGVRVIIVELQGKKELNGCRGVLVQYQNKAAVGRWNVKLDSSEVVSVKPRNLSVLLDGTPEPSSDCGPRPAAAAQPMTGSSPAAASSGPGAYPMRRQPVVEVNGRHGGPSHCAQPGQQASPELAASFLGNASQEGRMPTMAGTSPIAQPATGTHTATGSCHSSPAGAPTAQPLETSSLQQSPASCATEPAAASSEDAAAVAAALARRASALEAAAAAATTLPVMAAGQLSESPATVQGLAPLGTGQAAVPAGSADASGSADAPRSLAASDAAASPPARAGDVHVTPEEAQPLLLASPPVAADSPSVAVEEVVE